MKSKKNNRSIHRINLWTAVVSLIVASIAIIPLFNSQRSVDRNDSQADTKNVVKTDTIYVTEQVPILMSNPEVKEDSKMEIDNLISQKIESFDQSYIDFTNTRLLIETIDTLEDGTTRQGRFPALRTKTTEETYIEMESYNAQLISVLETHHLSQSYQKILENQLAQLTHAHKAFSSNMGSTLFGLK